jgi:hypothetical protein
MWYDAQGRSKISVSGVINADKIEEIGHRLISLRNAPMATGPKGEKRPADVIGNPIPDPTAERPFLRRDEMLSRQYLKGRS